MPLAVRVKQRAGCDRMFTRDDLIFRIGPVVPTIPMGRYTQRTVAGFLRDLNGRLWIIHIQVGSTTRGRGSDRWENPPAWHIQ